MTTATLNSKCSHNCKLFPCKICLIVTGIYHSYYNTRVAFLLYVIVPHKKYHVLYFDSVLAASMSVFDVGKKECNLHHTRTHVFKLLFSLKCIYIYIYIYIYIRCTIITCTCIL